MELTREKNGDITSYITLNILTDITHIYILKYGGANYGKYYYGKLTKRIVRRSSASYRTGKS